MHLSWKDALHLSTQAWFDIFYVCSIIGDVLSRPGADSSCRSDWGSGAEYLVAFWFKGKNEDMLNGNGRLAYTLRVPAVWVDVMCMSKWVTKKVRILNSCMTSLFLYEPLLVLSLDLGCHIGITLTFLQVVDSTLHSYILWAQVLWPLCRVVAIMLSGCHSGAISIEAKDFQHSPAAQCSRCISLDCDGDGVLKGMSSE